MKNEKKEIKYFSMFTGVGGFELGLQRDRSSQSKCRGSKKDLLSRRSNSISKIFKCIGFSEIDKYASELLKQKFPTIKNWGDCTKINPNELPDFDMLCGGFPCQAFSIAGKRRGFQDTRGTLFFEIARILKIKRPKLILLENVKGLLNHEKGKTFSIIIQTLEELGYRTQWMVFNSKFFGVPQNRERVFIIGSLRGESRPEILPIGENEQEINREGAVVRTFTAGGHSGGLHSNSTGIIQIQSHSPRTNDPKKGGSGPLISKEHCFTLDRSPHYAIENPLKGKTDYGWHFEQNVYSEDSNCRSLKSGEGSGNKPKIIENMTIRKLTPIECERLQGFPDNWTEGFSDTQRYKMMGNAVTVNVIKAIAEKL